MAERAAKGIGKVVSSSTPLTEDSFAGLSPSGHQPRALRKAMTCSSQGDLAAT